MQQSIINKTTTVNKTNAAEMLFDLKTILGDYYVASLDLNGESLNIKFVNGQKFAVTVREIAELL